MVYIIISTSRGSGLQLLVTCYYIGSTIARDVLLYIESTIARDVLLYIESTIARDVLIHRVYNCS